MTPDAKTEPEVAPPKLKFAVWKGEPPKITGRKEREPNPYDDIVKQSYDEKKSFSTDIPDVDGMDLADVKKGQVRLLRNAARFHDIGVDIRFVGERTLWFQARDKREKKTDETAAAA